MLFGMIFLLLGVIFESILDVFGHIMIILTEVIFMIQFFDISAFLLKTEEL